MRYIIETFRGPHATWVGQVWQADVRVFESAPRMHEIEARRDAVKWVSVHVNGG